MGVYELDSSSRTTSEVDSSWTVLDLVSSNGSNFRTGSAASSQMKPQNGTGDSERVSEIDDSGGQPTHPVSLVVVLVTIFFGAICFALQAPFYPAEAARKGVTPTEYGFVFGIFQFVVLITSPFYGKYIKTIGSAFLYKSGVFVAAGCTILFGFLDNSPPKQTFLFLSIAIRVVAALGESAIYTSSYVLTIRCSAASAMAMAIAYVEIAFGVGSILGPTVGGALYQIGGFRLPFVVTGSVLMVGCFVSMFFIREIEEAGENVIGPSLFRVMRSPSILVYSYCVFISAVTVGFYTALVEPHVRPLGLNPLQVGLLFMVNGATYALSSAVWGRVVDRAGQVNTIIIAGCVAQIVALLIMGPLPFVPLEKTVLLVTAGLFLSGFGTGCNLVCSVIGIMEGIVECGYEKNMAAQGFVSGLYNGLFAAGCFVGPTVGGALFDIMGFPKASLVVWTMHVISLLLLLANKILTMQRRSKTVGPSTWLVASSQSSFDTSRSRVELSYENMTASTCNGIKTIA